MGSVIKSLRRTLEKQDPEWRKKRRARQHLRDHPKPRRGCKDCDARKG